MKKTVFYVIIIILAFCYMGCEGPQGSVGQQGDP